MLTEKQLEKNKTKFLETNQKYNIFSDELMEYFGEDFYMAPATTSLDMYGAYPGGLLHHLNKSCAYAIKLNNILPEDMQCNPKSIVRTIFISQIGKVNMFELNDVQWEIEKLKKVFKFKDDNFKLKTGERTMYIIMKYCIDISMEEFHAIISLDKMEDDKINKHFPTTLAEVVKIGFKLAIMEEKNGRK